METNSLLEDFIMTSYQNILKTISSIKTLSEPKGKGHFPHLVNLDVGNNLGLSLVSYRDDPKGVPDLGAPIAIILVTARFTWFMPYACMVFLLETFTNTTTDLTKKFAQGQVVNYEKEKKKEGTPFAFSYEYDESRRVYDFLDSELDGLIEAMTLLTKTVRLIKGTLSLEDDNKAISLVEHVAQIYKKVRKIEEDDYEYVMKNDIPTIKMLKYFYLLLIGDEIGDAALKEAIMKKDLNESDFDQETIALLYAMFISPPSDGIIKPQRKRFKK